MSRRRSRRSEEGSLRAANGDDLVPPSRRSTASFTHLKTTRIFCLFTNCFGVHESLKLCPHCPKALFFFFFVSKALSSSKRPSFAQLLQKVFNSHKYSHREKERTTPQTSSLCRRDGEMLRSHVTLNKKTEPIRRTGSCGGTNTPRERCSLLIILIIRVSWMIKR